VRYALSVPRDYVISRPAPLVLALHFGGNPHGAAFGLLKVLVVPGLADLNAVIVAPETLGRGWNSDENERGALALLDAVAASYRTDPRRVVVTGFSMGGAGAWHFAASYPDRFSAAIPLAGRPPAEVSTWTMPVLAVHSRADEVVPIAPTEARIKLLRDAGVRADVIVVDGITHYETSRFAEPLTRAVPWLRDTWKKLETTR
jgi:predicted peptidase